MKNFRLVSIVLLTAGCGFANDLRITVALWDYAGLDDAVARQALNFASAAFLRAGIDVTFSVCRLGAASVGCSIELPPNRNYLSMLVMPKMLSPVSGAEAADVAGYALTGAAAREEPRGWAFYHIICDTAKQTEHPVRFVLGCVLVHEIGHMLGLEHNTFGIMRPILCPGGLDEADRGHFFSPAQMQQLRLAAGRYTQQNRLSIAQTITHPKN